jgi:hypothetical protein
VENRWTPSLICISTIPKSVLFSALRIGKRGLRSFVPERSSWTIERLPLMGADFAEASQVRNRGLSHARSGRVRMNIWTEFKNAILPWVLASAVVAFMIAEHRRTTGALLEANTRLANAVEQQGKALDGVRTLLASQGYTLPPLTKPQ